jgi:hypothetical protein
MDHTPNTDHFENRIVVLLAMEDPHYKSHHSEDIANSEACWAIFEYNVSVREARHEKFQTYVVHTNHLEVEHWS